MSNQDVNSQETKMEGTRKKIKSKEEINNNSLPDLETFGNKLAIPAHIKKELEAAGFAHRFVSLKKLQDGGGYHPMGWTPYTVKNPVPNPITGQTENVFRIGDLVLAVKTAADHQKHVNWLKQKSKGQSQAHKDSVKEMRDKIKLGKADKHISVFEGYEENDGTDDE